MLKTILFSVSDNLSSAYQCVIDFLNFCKISITEIAIKLPNNPNTHIITENTTSTTLTGGSMFPTVRKQQREQVIIKKAFYLITPVLKTHFALHGEKSLS